MSNLYWVSTADNVTNWSDYTNHWSTSSGGAANASDYPKAGDIAIFDDNSFPNDNKTITFDVDINVYRLENNVNIHAFGVQPDLSEHNITIGGGADIIGKKRGIGVSIWNNNRPFTKPIICLNGGVSTAPDFEFINLSTFTQGITVGNNITLKIISGALDLGTGTDLTLGDGTGVINLVNGASGIYCKNFIANTTGSIDFGNAPVQLSGNFSSTNADLHLGSSVLSVVDWTVNGGTFDAGTSTIGVSGTFNGGGKTYNIVNVYSGIINGSNTFNTLDVQEGSTLDIKFQAGSTQTITNFPNISSGSDDNIVTLESTVAGVPFTLSMASGDVTCDYIIIKDSIATGGANWLASFHGVNGGGNSGWVFVLDALAVKSPEGKIDTEVIPKGKIETIQSPKFEAVINTQPKFEVITN